jgi:hypothetical protein
MRDGKGGFPVALRVCGAASATGTRVDRDTGAAKTGPAGPASDIFEAAKIFFVGFEVPGGSYFFDLDLDMGHIQ